MAQKRKVKKKNKVLKAIKKFLISILILAVIGITLTALSCTVFFNIKEISASGSDFYSKEEIIEASDISIGDNLILLNKQEIAEKLSKKLPLTGNVQIDKKLPDKVSIKVKDAVADMVFIQNDKYLYTSNYKAIKFSQKQPKREMLILSDIGKAKLGENVAVKDETKQVIDLICQQLNNQDITEINQIDVSDISDISVICLGRFKVMLGSVDSLEYKVANVKQIINSVDEKYGNKVQGTIKVQTLNDQNNKSYFKIGNVSVEKPTKNNKS